MSKPLKITFTKFIQTIYFESKYGCENYFEIKKINKFYFVGKTYKYVYNRIATMVLIIGTGLGVLYILAYKLIPQKNSLYVFYNINK